MPALIRSEFALALNQVCSERGIDPSVVLETIKAAIAAAYKKDYGGTVEDYIVEINSDSGEAKVFKKNENGELGEEVTPPGFGRIAAQTARQVIIQRVREAEKTAILSDYSSRVGTIVNGMILRFDGPNVVVDIGKAEGTMPPQEQSQNEEYNLNQRLVFFIVGIRETSRGSEIVVSRTHEGLVEGLFKREVPEVQSGAVEIKGITREAGSRTKVAVTSSQEGVDPVGSCVGQKGVRVLAVTNELGGQEKIDIVQYFEEPTKFIAAALSPAKGIEVTIDQGKRTAVATVPDDQLSLAIGKTGQNVRLAAKLTGYKIDIKGKSQKQETKEEIKEVKEETEITHTEEKPTKKTAKKKERKKTEPKKVNSKKSKKE